ncbi:MAG: hypothetical protein HQK72_07825 [Desulfamplus sp.]|nr:hypothetical protein [Desulfamplus sp.]
MTHHQEHHHSHSSHSHSHHHSDGLDSQSHAHDHSHGSCKHSHNNSHGSDSHSHHHHSEEELSLAQKFSMLLKHWIDHNNSHKESYISWANKVDSDKSESTNLSEAAKLLRQTAELSDKITEHLENALKSIKG